MRTGCWMAIFMCGCVSLAGAHEIPGRINGLGRWLGLGWSAGYHTRDNCGNSSCAPHTDEFEMSVGETAYDTFLPTTSPAQSPRPIERAAEPLPAPRYAPPASDKPTPAQREPEVPMLQIPSRSVVPPPPPPPVDQIEKGTSTSRRARPAYGEMKRYPLSEQR